jgi:hypothetical protein
MKSGVLLATEGCLPSVKGARVRLSGGKSTVTDGPFTESKELVAGFALIQAKWTEEAIEHTKRFLKVAGTVRARFARCSRSRISLSQPIFRRSARAKHGVSSCRKARQPVAAGCPTLLVEGWDPAAQDRPTDPPWNVSSFCTPGRRPSRLFPSVWRCGIPPACPAGRLGLHLTN